MFRSVDVFITIFSKLLLEFVIGNCFKIFEYLFNDHYWPTKLFKPCR